MDLPHETWTKVYSSIADNLASVSGHMIKVKGHLGSMNFDHVGVTALKS